MPTVTPIRLKGRELRPHKSIIEPLLGARTVLTNSPWTFVALWLKRAKKNDAAFYWRQANEFYTASTGLPLQSAPLLLYYSFLNAAKALLVVKGIPFHEHHGVRAHNMRKPTSKISIVNEGIRILSKGVVASLSSYYGEAESESTHSLQELLFNMAFIHRTYCLTYTRQTEMFLPLVDCKYLRDKKTKRAYLSAELSSDLEPRQIAKRLPPSLVQDISFGPRAIKTVTSIPCSKTTNPTAADLHGLVDLHRRSRNDLHYINGAQTLWYAKTLVSGPRRLCRQSPTMVLAAMHRLSEICRYRPLELASHLSGQKNWLLSEFIQMSPVQFIDEMASEITGYQFLMPNVRAPA
jgi:uncharacterized protein (UPF0332 family)